MINILETIRNLSKAKLIFLLLVLGIGSIVVSRVITRFTGNNEEVIKPVVAGVQLLSVERVTETRVPLKLSGTVRAKQSTVVRSLVQGTMQTLIPVGFEVSKGQPLFRLSNDSIEQSYQIALRAFSDSQLNASQTRLSAETVFAQSELTLSDTLLRLEQAESSLIDAKRTTDLQSQQAGDAAVIVYDSAFVSVESVLRFWGGANLERFIYEDVLSNDLKILASIRSLFDQSKSEFLALPRRSGTNIDFSIAVIESLVNKTKLLNSNVRSFLQQGVPSTGFSENALALGVNQATAFATQLGALDTQVKTARSSLHSVEIQNQIALRSQERQVELAKLAVANAQKNLERQKTNANLANLGASAQLNSVEAQLASARFQFENLQLPAPFGGVVLAHSTNAGSQIAPGQAILELGNSDLVEIRLEVSLDVALALHLGQAVEINQGQTGRIAEIEAGASADTGKVGVVIEADNGQNNFLLGRVVDVQLELTYEFASKILVPLRDVIVGQTRNNVLLFENGLVADRVVSLGQVFGDLVEIISGLEEGEELIVNTNKVITPGETVKIRE